MLVLYLVWGSTYLGIAIAVDTIPPFVMAGVRFFLAGLVLLAWSVAREGRDFVCRRRREVARQPRSSAPCCSAAGWAWSPFGEQTVPSGIAALLVAMMPVWVAIFGGIFLGERLPRLAVVGIAVGFVGVAILVGPSALGGRAPSIRSVSSSCISPIAWATGSLFASHRAALPPAAGRDRRPDAVGGLVLLGARRRHRRVAPLRHRGGVIARSLVASCT